MKKTIFFLISAFAFCKAQTQTIPVSSASAPEAFSYLVLPQKELREDPIRMETLLDLVQPSTIDTAVWPETQRHRFPGSDILESAAELYWESLTLKREKMIGKVCREISNYDGALKEFDVNYYIIPHLPVYMDMLYSWWMAASDKGRQISKSYKRKAPFTVPDKMKIYDDFYYYIECENTPIRSYMDSMYKYLHPCLPGTKIEEHPNFGYATPSIGFYGPAVMDCNHECKPEIHPYEWIWWLNVNPVKDGKEEDKEWVIGLLRDWSGRFRNWSTRPRKGMIRVPFAFVLQAPAKILEIEHGTWDKFVPSGLADIPGIPADAQDGSKTETILSLQDHGMLTIKTNRTIPNSGIRYWVSDVKADQQKSLLSGYLNIAVSVENVYTVKVRMDR